MPKKLKLNLEDIEIESFETIAEGGLNSGTVQGASGDPFDASCWQGNCCYIWTGADVCNNTDPYYTCSGGCYTDYCATGDQGCGHTVHTSCETVGDPSCDATYCGSCPGTCQGCWTSDPSMSECSCSTGGSCEFEIC